jgi:hypothetical protein
MAPKDLGWGRRLDYSQSVNLTNTPGAADQDGSEPTFAQLHKMASSWDLLSIVLYTMLERIAKYDGRVLDIGGDPLKPSKKAQAIKDQFRFPDGSTPFSTWLQSLAWDMAVTDNAMVVINKDGSTPLAEVSDGQTWKMCLDERGRARMAQQIIKGNPAHNYALDKDVVWCPKHVRPNKVYGFSYVRQMRSTISLALQRTARQIDYFTKGNIPAMLLEAPANWTPTMVQEANTNWRDILAGVSGKEEVQIVPNGMKPHEFTREVAKSDFDEWLARVACSCVSVPATPYIKEVNRATAEQTQAASIQEGHSSQLRWASDSLTRVITAMHGPGFIWQWDTDTRPDGAMVADLVKSKALKPSALVRLGFSPEEIADEVQTEPVADLTKITKAEKPEAPKPPKKPKAGSVKNADFEPDSLSDLLQLHLDDLRDEAVDKAPDAFAGKEFTIDTTPSRAFVLRVASILNDAAIQGADEAMMKTDRTPVDVSDYETPSLKYAKEQSASMVGMKWDGQKLIPNPDVKWQVSDMVRDAIRQNVAKAFEDVWSPQKLAEQIAADHAFSPARAMAIARDQIATAQEVGSFEYFKAAGVTGKRWSQYDACPTCTGNAAQGVIKIADEFASGHIHAPAHPNCRCRIIPEEIKA